MSRWYYLADDGKTPVSGPLMSDGHPDYVAIDALLQNREYRQLGDDQIGDVAGSFRGQMATVLRRTGNVWMVRLTTGAQLSFRCGEGSVMNQHSASTWEQVRDLQMRRARDLRSWMNYPRSSDRDRRLTTIRMFVKSARRCNHKALAARRLAKAEVPA